MEAALGWTQWLHRPGSSEAWFDAYRAGQSLWGAWLKGHRLEDDAQQDKQVSSYSTKEAMR